MSCGCNKTPCGCSSGGPHHEANPRPHNTGGFPGGPPCRKHPCECGRSAPPNPCEPEKRCTRCDLYVQGTPNVWVERGAVSPDLFQAEQPEYKVPGICALDTLSDAQIINIIERDDRARADLLKITSDPHLRKLALTVPKLPTQELVDAEQLNQNRPNEPSSIPFYAVFRGQPPFPQ